MPQLNEFEALAQNSVDLKCKYLKKTYVKGISNGPQVEERIYRGIFRNGFTMAGSLDMDQVLDALKMLLKTHITHNHYVKLIAYNDVTDEVMIIAKKGVYVNNIIVGSIETVNEPSI